MRVISQVSALLTCNSGGVLRHHAVTSCCNDDHDDVNTEMMTSTSPFDAMLLGAGTTCCQDALPAKTYACTAHIQPIT